jgi:hypothetical protein
MPWLWCVLTCVLLAAPASAQEPEPVDTEVPSTPTVQFRGFADINFAATDNHKSDDGLSADGFSLGNIVAHVSSSLGGKFSFYSEVTVTNRNNAFFVDIARAILRYDYNDRFKISVGRYHAPIGYWNTAFHRGLWLQTSIFRPDLVKEEWFQPDHFVGVVAEGTLIPNAGLGYIVGYGNGRELDLRAQGLQAADLYGDTENVGHHRAQVLRLFARPPQVSGVEFGGAVYHDELASTGTTGVPELITSAYVAITRESPELIAEFSNLRHTYFGTDYNSQAYYVQVGYRIPAQPRWKPYVRYEKADAPDDEPVTGALTNSKITGGLRFELTDFATLTVEYGQRRRPGAAHINGVFAQTAFTF